jgi:hypothetical protein
MQRIERARLEGGDMDEIWNRFVENLAGRVSGPMKLRLVLQPTMASIFAIRAGLTDAKVGRAPYLWALLTNPAHRSDMLRDGWKSVGKVFVIALALDVVYQLKELHTVYPIEALIVALLLAIVPYLLLRGLVTRLASKK